jgi:hypothetical protein
MTPLLSFRRHRDRVRLIADDADADLRRVSPEAKLWRAAGRGTASARIVKPGQGLLVGAAAHRSRLNATRSSDAACRPPMSSPQTHQLSRIESTMLAFIRVRGPRVAGVMLIMLAISLAQSGISYSMAFGGLGDFMAQDRSIFARGLMTLSLGLVALMAALWVLKRKQALFVCVVFTNAVFTCALLLHMSGLVGVLFGSVSEAVNTLMIDVVLMASTNILIFSIWYWVIDPPGFEDVPHAYEAWDFLFPQRAGSIPHYESWEPGYADYLFLAFTTSFAFSPTDTAPLTKRAKMLMLLQATISVVTLTAIAGSAINILAGGK